jgi:hypothetical protein
LLLNEYSPAAAKVKAKLRFAPFFLPPRAVRHRPGARPRMPAHPLSSEAAMSDHPDPDLRPGDEAEPGTPGTAEDLCETCGGSGKVAGGKTCPECEGTGRVIRGIGGG